VKQVIKSFAACEGSVTTVFSNSVCLWKSLHVEQEWYYTTVCGLRRKQNYMPKVKGYWQGEALAKGNNNFTKGTQL